MSIRVVGSSEVDEVTVIEFIRAAAVGNVAVALDKAIYINYAIGNEDRLVEHPSNGKGSLRLNLASGQAHALKSPREVMYLAHGSLMVIAWLGFIPLGKHLPFCNLGSSLELLCITSNKQSELSLIVIPVCSSCCFVLIRAQDNYGHWCCMQRVCIIAYVA